MWKWVIIILLGYGAYRMFMNDRSKKVDNEKAEREQRVAAGELVRDPVCGTYIDADSTITVRNGETLHRFCSYDCRDKFLAEQKKLEGGE